MQTAMPPITNNQSSNFYLPNIDTYIRDRNVALIIAACRDIKSTNSHKLALTADLEFIALTIEL